MQAKNIGAVSKIGDGARHPQDAAHRTRRQLQQINDPEPVDQGTLAGRLIAKRRELGLSQREAARSVGIDPGTWAGWELGAKIGREAHRRAVEGFLGTEGFSRPEVNLTPP